MYKAPIRNYKLFEQFGNAMPCIPPLWKGATAEQWETFIECWIMTQPEWMRPYLRDLFNILQFFHDPGEYIWRKLKKLWEWLEGEGAAASRDAIKTEITKLSTQSKPEEPHIGARTTTPDVTLHQTVRETNTMPNNRLNNNEYKSLNESIQRMNEQLVPGLTPHLNPSGESWIGVPWLRDNFRFKKWIHDNRVRNKKGLVGDGTTPTFDNNYNLPNNEGNRGPNSAGWFGLDGVIHDWPEEPADEPWVDEDGNIWP